MEKLQVVKLATDMIANRVPANFADTSKNSDALIDALIEANGGSSEISFKNFNRGNACFEIIEEIIPLIVHEGLKGNEFFMNLVDYRNIALGDDIDFWTEDKTELIVSDAAYGVTGIRRQRLGNKEKYNIDTRLKVVKVYEELKRLLAKRIDFNEFIKKVADAFLKDRYNEIYTAFDGISATTRGLNSTYVQSGTYSEDALLTQIQHVEAANEAVATIIGTKTALRKIATAVVSDEAKSDMYNMGFYGKFNGTNMIWVPQRHKVGTDEFLLNDNKIYIIAGDEKPIKYVTKGEGIMSVNDPLQSADFTQNYLYAEEAGVGVAFSNKIGIRTLS